jgi:hypothetical protein
MTTLLIWPTVCSNRSICIMTICSRTLAVCQTNLRVKRFLSLNPLPLTRVPPDVTVSKLIARTLCLAIKFGIRVGRSMVLFLLRNVRLSVMLWAFLSHGNLTLISEICLEAWMVSFHPAPGLTEIYTAQRRALSIQFWFYQTTSTPWRWERS